MKARVYPARMESIINPGFLITGIPAIFVAAPAVKYLNSPSISCMMLSVSCLLSAREDVNEIRVS
ncbi:hypothetical protein D3C84_1086250 [compost metagenome]